MNVSITAPVFDLDGFVLLTNVSMDGLMGLSRRNNRIPTLDGAAVIPDFGYSDSDRTFDVSWRPTSKEPVETLRSLVKKYSRLIVSIGEGCFIGAPGSFSFSNGEVQIQILVEKRLDQ